MKKRLIICSDGTWNSPEEKSNGGICITNVLKLARAIVPYDEQETIHQVAFYDAGIGSESVGFIEKKVRGGTGWGIRKNIADCYRFLAHNYCKGDELFLFGFSRGAYTVRLLSGLLEKVGILTKKDLDHLPQILEFYRGSDKKRNKAEYREIRSIITTTVKPTIHFLGVWDTVGALGIPTPLIKKLTQRWVGFSDVHLSGTVEKAYQALAIDERRAPFAPAIWDKHNPQQHLEQVWFAGVHSDVGGGYRENGLSLIALDWMTRRAMESGLKLDASFLENLCPAADDERRALGMQHDTMNFGYQALNVLNRKVGRLVGNKTPEYRSVGTLPDCGEMLHESVLTRLRKDPSYRPANLLAADADPDQLVVEQDGHTFLNIHGVRIPISHARQDVRHPMHLQADLQLANGNSEDCEILNFNPAGGALLKLAAPPAPGADGVLHSEQTGPKKFRVVWSNNDHAGVRFAV